jgi:hypothetical protein
MTPIAAGYAWFPERCAALAEAYCLTLVAGLTPEETVDRLGGERVRRLTGLAQVLAPGADAGDEEFVAVAAVPGWGSLVVEPYGYLGVTEEVNGPLSRGTTLVAHYRNVLGADQFVHIEDGAVRLDFAPSQGADAGPVTRADFTRAPVATALALAEHLTGVRLTAEFLETADYLCADVPEPL